MALEHQARKRFGQNFLVDQNIIRNIVAAIAPQKNQTMVEIGPGLGALTKHLLPLLNKLDVIEIDRDIIPKLEKNCEGLGDLNIHEVDALKFDFSSMSSTNLRVVGNLPYNISTPLLFHLLEYANQIQDMHFMLQKEVVDRICANVNTKDYGRLSVMIQYHCQTDNLFKVPPTAFKPQPKVDSAIVRLVPKKDKSPVAKNMKHFEDIVRQAFSMRRKTLGKSLKGMVSKDQLEALDIDSSLRPENITVQQFVQISNAIA